MPSPDSTDRRAQGHAGDDAVHSEAEQRGRPVQAGGAADRCMRVVLVMVVVAVAVSAFGFGFGAVVAGVGLRGRLMVMKREEALHQEDDQEPAKQPPHGGGAPVAGDVVVGCILHHGMRQHVQQRDAEHHPRDKAQRHLEPAVGQRDDHRQPPADERDDDDGQAVDRQQKRRRHDTDHKPGDAETLNR